MHSPRSRRPRPSSLSPLCPRRRLLRRPSPTLLIVAPSSKCGGGTGGGRRTTVIVVVVIVDDALDLLPSLLRLLRVRTPCPRRAHPAAAWLVGIYPELGKVRHYPEVDARVLSSRARLLRLGLLCQRPSFVNRRVTNYLCFIFARGSCGRTPPSLSFGLVNTEPPAPCFALVVPFAAAPVCHRANHLSVFTPMI